jgi:hypothetical protein
MQIEKQLSSSYTQPDPSMWHFRAIPEEVQRCTVRRLTLCGLPDYEIAARTGWPIDRVRKVMREDVPGALSQN